MVRDYLQFDYSGYTKNSFDLVVIDESGNIESVNLDLNSCTMVECPEWAGDYLDSGKWGVHANKAGLHVSVYGVRKTELSGPVGEPKRQILTVWRAKRA